MLLDRLKVFVFRKLRLSCLSGNFGLSGLRLLRLLLTIATLGFLAFVKLRPGLVISPFLQKTLNALCIPGLVALAPLGALVNWLLTTGFRFRLTLAFRLGRGFPLFGFFRGFLDGTVFVKSVFG